MHELGVVFNVIDRAKEVATENNADHIDSVTLLIGQVPTVIPSYLTDCWKWAVKKESMMKNAELKILTVPAVTHCDDCGEDYDTIPHGKICPKCGSPNTWLLQGNEFIIDEIEISDSGSE